MNSPALVIYFLESFIYHADQGEEWRLPDSIVMLQYYDSNLGTWVDLDDETIS